MSLFLNLIATKTGQFLKDRLFHEICLLLRIYISNIQIFNENSNQLIHESSSLPCVRNTALLLKIIEQEIYPLNLGSATLKVSVEVMNNQMNDEQT